MLVVIHHNEQLKNIFGIPNWKCAFVGISGPLGVKLFFVLSGFLITYLLLAEEHKTSNINIIKFYFRRILRIWPLYFLLVFSSLLILPNFDFFMWPNFGKEIVQHDLVVKLILYGTFFASMVIPFFGIVPYASQAWSVGTEEQFYLIWPLLVKFVKKFRVLLFLGVIIGYSLVKVLLVSKCMWYFPYLKIIRTFWFNFSIDCMAIGGFFAYILFTRKKFLFLFQNIYLFYSSLISVTILTIIGFHFPFWDNQIYCVLFGIVILNFASNQENKISLESKPLNYLGQISYGIYMFHPLGIVLSIKTGMLIGIYSNFLFLPLTFGFTILLASISYRFYESKFLKVKESFSNVKSGDAPEQAKASMKRKVSNKTKK